MKIQAQCHRFLILIGVFRTPDEQSKRIKIRNASIGVIIFALLLLRSIAGFCFVYKNVNVNLEFALYALMQVSSFSCQAYSIIILHVKKPKFIAVFAKLQQIYDKSEFSEFCYYIPLAAQF